MNLEVFADQSSMLAAVRANGAIAFATDTQRHYVRSTIDRSEV